MQRTTSRRWLLPLVAAAALAAFLPPDQASAATSPVYDEDGRLIETPFVPPAPEPDLSEDEAIQKYPELTKL